MLTSSPAQRTLEKNSPQIYGEDGEIWRELIKRDVPDWETKADELKNPKDWYTVYRVRHGPASLHWWYANSSLETRQRERGTDRS